MFAINNFHAMGKFNRQQTDDILMIFFLFFLENLGADKSYFLGKIKKVFHNVIC